MLAVVEDGDLPSTAEEKPATADSAISTISTAPLFSVIKSLDATSHSEVAPLSQRVAAAAAISTDPLFSAIATGDAAPAHSAPAVAAAAAAAAAATATHDALSSDWRQTVDPKSTRPFWWNVRTRERSWHAPPPPGPGRGCDSTGGAAVNAGAEDAAASDAAASVEHAAAGDAAAAVEHATAARSAVAREVALATNAHAAARIAALNDEISAYADRQSRVAAKVAAGAFPGVALDELWPEALIVGRQDGFTASTIALAAVTAELHAARFELGAEARAYASETVQMGVTSARELADQRAAHERTVAQLDAAHAAHGALADEVDTLRAHADIALSVQLRVADARVRAEHDHAVQLAALQRTAASERAVLAALADEWKGTCAAVEERAASFEGELEALRAERRELAGDGARAAEATRALAHAELIEQQQARDFVAARKGAGRGAQLQRDTAEARDALAALRCDYASVVDSARRLYVQCESTAAEQAIGARAPSPLRLAAAASLPSSYRTGLAAAVAAAVPAALARPALRTAVEVTEVS